jgi:hypothetical protein
MAQRARRQRRPWGWVGENPAGSGRFGIRYREAAGRQVREGPFASRRLAEEALAARRAAMGGGTYVAKQELTVAEWFATWLDSQTTLGRRATTIAGYTAMVRRHILPSLGRIGLQKLSATDLDAL